MSIWRKDKNGHVVADSNPIRRDAAGLTLIVQDGRQPTNVPGKEHQVLGSRVWAGVRSGLYLQRLAGTACGFMRRSIRLRIGKRQRRVHHSLCRT
jgi:hypothetical protein